MLPLKKILWPTDFSDASGAAFTTAIELAGHFKAAIICVNVITPPPRHSEWADASKFTVPLSIQQEQDENRAALETLLSKQCPAEVSREVMVLIGEAPTEILKAAEQTGADLIVMATHGRSGVGRLVFGSVADSVVRQAACPVLTVRPPQATA